jgi:predicted phage tail protein
MDKLLLFLNSAYLGLGAFFSFYVAPTLFKVLEKTEAGKVVERVFPVYFSLGIVVMLISTLLGWKVSRSFFLLALINLLIHLVHRFYVLPTASALKIVDYSAFMKWHGISMLLNGISLLLTLVMIIILSKRGG